MTRAEDINSLGLDVLSNAPDVPGNADRRALAQRVYDLGHTLEDENESFRFMFERILQINKGALLDPPNNAEIQTLLDNFPRE